MDRTPQVLGQDLPLSCLNGMRVQGQGAVLLQLAAVHLRPTCSHTRPIASLPLEHYA